MGLYASSGEQLVPGDQELSHDIAVCGKVPPTNHLNRDEGRYVVDKLNRKLLTQKVLVRKHIST